MAFSWFSSFYTMASAAYSVAKTISNNAASSANTISTSPTSSRSSAPAAPVSTASTVSKPAVAPVVTTTTNTYNSVTTPTAPVTTYNSSAKVVVTPTSSTTNIPQTTQVSTVQTTNSTAKTTPTTTVTTYNSSGKSVEAAINTNNTIAKATTVNTPAVTTESSSTKAAADLVAKTLTTYSPLAKIVENTVNAVVQVIKNSVPKETTSQSATTYNSSGDTNTKSTSTVNTQANTNKTTQVIESTSNIKYNSGKIETQQNTTKVPSNSANESTAKSSTSNPLLKMGSENSNDVKRLQQMLISKGYDLGKYESDGDFGSKTKEAVMKFQKDNNLQVDGIVGANTWGQLNKGSALSSVSKASALNQNTSAMQKIVNAPVLKVGSQDTQNVKMLQQTLIMLEYDLGTAGADGDFGAKTKAAVEKFQKDNKLEVDGIVGAKTIAALKETSRNVESVGIGNISFSFTANNTAVKSQSINNPLAELYDTSKFVKGYDNGNKVEAKGDTRSVIRAMTPQEERRLATSKTIPKLPVVSTINDIKISFTGTDLTGFPKTEDEIQVAKVSAFLDMGLSGIGTIAKTVAKEGNVLAKNLTKVESKVDIITKGDINTVIKNSKISIDDLKANPNIFNGKSADEIASMLKESGYDITIKNSTRSSSGAQIIKINNPGGGKNISQVQVSPGGGRHGTSPYVKISTTDQGIIKIINGPESLYKTDGLETSTNIFTGGN